MFASLLIGLSLIVGSIALIAWGRNQWRKARYAEACDAYNQATARFRDAKRRGDTRDQHAAQAALNAAMTNLLRREGAS